jgi:hypothetical protein
LTQLDLALARLKMSPGQLVQIICTGHTVLTQVTTLDLQLPAVQHSNWRLHSLLPPVRPINVHFAGSQPAFLH